MQCDALASYLGFGSEEELIAFVKEHQQSEPVMPEHSEESAYIAATIFKALDNGNSMAASKIERLKEEVAYLKDLCHGNAVNAGWYHDVKTGKWKNLNVGERFMLMVTELAEGFEGFRKDRPDDHLPHRSNMEVELADLVIRCMDFAGSENLDIAGAIMEKMQYNRSRADHKPENRAKEGGKKC